MNALMSPRPTIIPKPHQQATLEFLLGNKRAFNLSEMGTGKTLPSVQAVGLLFDAGYLQRVLVVAPISVIRATWLDHFERFAPHVTVTLLDEATKRKKQVEDMPNGVVIINPDGIKSVFHELVEWVPQLIIVDELAGYYRNTRTQRWKALAALDTICKPAMWAFTGTPVSNGLCDVYAQIMLVNASNLPKASNGRPVMFIQFRDMLHKQPYPNTWVPKDGALERVYGMMQPAVRYTRKEVMKDVSEAIRIRKDVPLSPDQKKLLKQLEDDGRAQYGDAEIRGAAATAVVTKILQIMTGAVYDKDGEVVEIPADSRIEALFDLWEEIEHTPLIVTAPFVHTIQRLEKEIRFRGHRVRVIYGDVSVQKRLEIVEAFQRGEVDFLVCHPRTMAHGLTLTASHTVLWFAPLYDLELYEQANARIERYGQEGQPLIVEFCGCPAERKIYEALRKKQKLQGTFLSFFK